MNFEEFLQPKGEDKVVEKKEQAPVEEPAPVEELDVQKVVVEELAADKAAMNDEITSLRNEITKLRASLEENQRALQAAQEERKAAEDALKDNAVIGERDSLKAQLAAIQEKYAALETAFACKENELAAEKVRESDTQERNPNALALLDRDEEIGDRFPGETRDHVLEVVKEARDQAEKEGRARKAQLLESVLVANEPNGNLAKKRSEMEKLFADNGNLVTGPVIEELTRLGISHKNGEEYLLPSEILKRNY